MTPTSIIKDVRDSRLAGSKVAIPEEKPEIDVTRLSKKELQYYLEELKDRMDLAAKNLEFEKAATLRDQVIEINKSLKRKKHQL